MNRSAIHETGILLVALALIIAAIRLLPAAESAPARPSRVQLEAMAEAYHRLPRGLEARVRAYEGDRNVIRKRVRNGDWYLVAGPYQLHVGKNWQYAADARGDAGPWMVARRLAKSRAWCAARPGTCPCPWARHNWGDRTALCAAMVAK